MFDVERRFKFLSALPSFGADGISGNQLPEAFHMLTEECPELFVDSIQFLWLGDGDGTIAQRPNAIFQAARHYIMREQTAENTRWRSFLTLHSLT